MKALTWILMLCAACAAAEAEAGPTGPATTEEQTRAIERKFPVTAQPAPRIQVDNVNGAISVVAHNSPEIHLVAKETFRADSPEKLEQARREVRLDIAQSGNTVTLYVDGPFRCHCGEGRRGSVNFRGRAGYTFRYDLELRVPASTALELRTINHGDIRVEGVAGDFDVDNVNGSVSLLEVSGSGRAYALNGKLRAVFRSNPKGNSFFGSLNGDVDLFFQPDLSADLRFKTFNGGVYTDFPLNPLPSAAPEVRRADGKFVYKSDRFTAGRIGRGGPEIKLDGFNGDIRVRQRTNQENIR